MGDTQQVAPRHRLYCANHPTVETLLRCSKCDKPICSRCGIRTPVGIRCRECAQLRRPPSYMVGVEHYLLAAAVALPVSFVAGLIMQRIGVFFAFFLGAAVGGLIGQVVYRVTGKRGSGMAWLVSGCIFIGAVASGFVLTVLLPGIPLAALLRGQALLGLLFRLNIVYVILAIGAAFTRLS